MTFEEAGAALQRDHWWSEHRKGTPLGDVAFAYIMLDWAESESEGDVLANVAEARSDLAAALVRCSPEELAALLAVGPADLREPALLALGQVAS